MVPARALALLLLAAPLLSACAGRPAVEWRALPGVSPDLASLAPPLARAIAEEAARARENLLRLRPQLAGRDPVLQRPPLPVTVAFFADEEKGQRWELSRVLEEGLARALDRLMGVEAYPPALARRWAAALRAKMPFNESLAVAVGEYSQARAVLFGGFRVVEGSLRVRAELVVVEEPRPPLPEPVSFFWPVVPKPAPPERRRLARVEARVNPWGIDGELFRDAAEEDGVSLPVAPLPWQRPPVAIAIDRILPDGSRQPALGGGILGPEDTLAIRLLALRPVHLYVATVDERGRVREVMAGPGGGALRREAEREAAAVASLRPPGRQVRLFVLARESPLDVAGAVRPALRRFARLWGERGSLPPGAGVLALPADVFQRCFWYYRAPVQPPVDRRAIRG